MAALGIDRITLTRDKTFQEHLPLNIKAKIH